LIEEDDGLVRESLTPRGRDRGLAIGVAEFCSRRSRF
jgi:hypothetical protein